MNLNRRWFWVWLSSFALFGLLWWVLTQSADTLWTLGFIAIVAALSVRLGWPGLRLGAVLRLPRFLIYFLPKVVLGAVGVAWLACNTRVRLTPSWHLYSPQPILQQHPVVLSVFASCICLTPGTLAWFEHPHGMSVHILNAHPDWQASLNRLEQEVCRWLLGATA